MKIIDGRLVSKEIYNELSQEIAKLESRTSRRPCLAVVIVGDDPASKIYVNRKVKIAKELSIDSIKHELPQNASQGEVLNLVSDLNNDASINGILVQSPPPAGIDERKIIESINPIKDVDCFHPYNVGKLMIGDEDGFLPCTPAGIMVLLNRYKVETQGKHAVVLGRSNIVGKPLALLLSRKSQRANATVTLCHSRTRSLSLLTRNADIIIAALGSAGFVTGEMVKDNVVIIDVGINRVTDAQCRNGYRLVGDVDFDEVSMKASLITPVPGGVGPMTVAVLMYNTLTAFCLQNGIPFSYRLF